MKIVPKNRFSGKTYFYTIAIRELLAERGTVRIGDGGSGDAQKLADVQPSMDISDEVIEDIKGKPRCEAHSLKMVNNES